MDAKKVIQEFLRAFEKMDIAALTPLLAPHAMVDSPTLGKKEAIPFYKELFSKSKWVKVLLKDIFINPDKPNRAAAFSTFSWHTKAGEPMSFETVVIYEFNPQGKIQHIHIIYDAQLARESLRKVG